MVRNKVGWAGLPKVSGGSTGRLGSANDEISSLTNDQAVFNQTIEKDKEIV